MPKTIIDERGVVIVPGTGVEINLPVTFSQTASFTSTVVEEGDAVYDGDYTFSGTVDFANSSSFDAPAEFNDNTSFYAPAEFKDDTSFYTPVEFNDNVDFKGAVRSSQGYACIENSLDSPGQTGLLDPGVYTLDTSGGPGQAVTASLQDPNNIPGAEYIFLATQTQDHMITCSEVPYNAISNAQTVGSGTRVTTPGDVYDSIVFKSDGYRYLVLGASGSCVLDGAV